MSTYADLKKDLKERDRLDRLSKRDKIMLEQAWFEDHKHIGCAKCPRKDAPSIDHVVPRDLLTQFGIDIYKIFMEKNLQILCKPCNIFKGNRLDFTNPLTKEILIELIQGL